MAVFHKGHVQAALRKYNRDVQPFFDIGLQLFVIVVWFVGRTCKKNQKWYTSTA